MFILSFVFWLNKKLKKPITKLNDAMISFADGKKVEINDYNGPLEFERICENFNTMISKLSYSENKRILLESDRKRMIANISHDLKTPITTIKGYSKALMDGLINKEDVSKYYRIIYNKSDNLAELINTFYDYVKLDHPDIIFNNERVDLSEVLREYIIEKYDYINDIGFEFEIEIPDEKYYCNIDKVQFTRALDNIITNSVRHNNEGTIIYLRLDKKDNLYEITLGDNGCGIPEDIKDNVFSPFIIGDESRSSKGGTGLGLAITKNIIEKHNGEINLVYNAKWKTLFVIRIPR